MVDRIEGIGPVFPEKLNKSKGKGNFADILKQAIDRVNELQKRAEKLTDDFAEGRISNIHEVIIEAEKASLALRLTVEVRNRIVEAYRDIMRMQI